MPENVQNSFDSDKEGDNGFIHLKPARIETKSENQINAIQQKKGMHKDSDVSNSNKNSNAMKESIIKPSDFLETDGKNLQAQIQEEDEEDRENNHIQQTNWNFSKEYSNSKESKQNILEHFTKYPFFQEKRKV